MELSDKSTVGTNLSTNATGNASFTVTEDGNEMSYTVNTMLTFLSLSPVIQQEIIHLYYISDDMYVLLSLAHISFELIN